MEDARDGVGIPALPLRRGCRRRDAGGGRGTEDASSKQLAPHELATRLSLFLWCSTPDDKLLRAGAEAGHLARSGSGSSAQVQPDARWILSVTRGSGSTSCASGSNLQLLDFLHVDKKVLSRGSTRISNAAMRREPVAFFEEVLGAQQLQRSGVPARGLHHGQRAAGVALRGERSLRAITVQSHRTRRRIGVAVRPVDPGRAPGHELRRQGLASRSSGGSGCSSASSTTRRRRRPRRFRRSIWPIRASPR